MIQQRENFILVLIAFFVFILIFTSACTSENTLSDKNPSGTSLQAEQKGGFLQPKGPAQISKEVPVNEINVNQALTVHFIDVGQGDSELIQYHGKNMLIDAGNSEHGSTVVQYLLSQNVSKIDTVIVTHPHADHIGGIGKVISAFPVGLFIDSGYSYDTPTYQNIMKSVDKKGIPYRTVRADDTISFDPQMSLIVFNPSETGSKDPNENSIVVKVKVGNVGYLFMSDASTTVEKKLLSNGKDISADILKVGHHGSTSSSGISFLGGVRPKVSIIEVGSELAHSSQSIKTMKNLESIGSKVYETSESGSIVITSDGTHYNVTWTGQTDSQQRFGN